METIEINNNTVELTEFEINKKDRDLLFETYCEFDDPVVTSVS